MGQYIATNNREACKWFKQYIIELSGENYWRGLTNTDKRCMFLDWVDAYEKDGSFPERSRDWYWLY